MVCFSASADFVAAGAFATVAVATLCQVRRRSEVLFGVLPALFALHQLTEGFVWLRVDGGLSASAGDAAAYAYVLYAQGILPALVPLSVLLMEPPGRRRRLVPFVIFGVLTAVFLFWVDAAHAISCHEQQHCIAYETDGRFLGVAVFAYVVATCGAALFSGYPWMVIFGVANLAGMAVTLILRASAFTSLWCLYSAVTSVFVLLVLLRRRRGQPPGDGRALVRIRPATQISHSRQDQRCMRVILPVIRCSHVDPVRVRVLVGAVRRRP
ncbi:DUF6629 family protein [Krasilnikovia sp. M28-CT-15]|uniref:DUF6629 family protein n=1 Tax=Krasilnikovia sp. M28-CT-15 TaxID=3373540 RepID=UPI003875C1AD